ncbi:uncharacterized protein LOC129794986 [Lutzomyia longipalpis]|uniref:uncharacterized protein LOC129794986 n=1 Tax=Lutzomyia longipalpis TaxID=7200 RepID=UPI0024839472|nr:uncharacterized protein LOC129794986 [Lutzomyia longipalpis]
MWNNFDPRIFSSISTSKGNSGGDQNTIFSTVLGAQEIKLLIREFNPSKNRDLYANEWIQSIEQLGRVYRWDPYHLLLYASMRLTGIARLWYDYSLELISNWEDFKRELLKNFPRTIDLADIQAKLESKKRQPDEPAIQYVHTTVKLAKMLQLDDASTVEYLVNGLDNVNHQMILSTMNVNTPKEFLQHLDHLESDDDHFKVPQLPKNRARSPEKATPSQESTKNKRRRGSPDEQIEKEPASSPPKKKNKKLKPCRICNSEEHVPRVCPKKKEQMMEGSTDADDASSTDSRTSETSALTKQEKEREENEIFQSILNLSEEDLCKKEDLLFLLQLGDEKLRRIRQSIEGCSKMDKCLTFYQGEYKLINRALFKGQQDEDFNNLKYCLSSKMQSRVMNLTHISAGHADSDELVDLMIKLRPVFHMVGILGSVKRYLTECIQCSVQKLFNSGEQHFTCTKERCFIPFYMLYVGFFGPIQKSNNSNEYIFAAMDATTQYTILEAVPSPCCEIVEKTLMRIAEHLASPSLVVSLQKEPFTSTRFEEFCRENGLKQGFVVDVSEKSTSFATSKHRGFFHGVITEAVSKICEAPDTTDWEEKLPDAQSQINSSNLNEKSDLNPRERIVKYVPRSGALEKAVYMKACETVKKRISRRFLNDSDEADEVEEKEDKEDLKAEKEEQEEEKEERDENKVDQNKENEDQSREETDQDEKEKEDQNKGKGDQKKNEDQSKKDNQEEAEDQRKENEDQEEPEDQSKEKENNAEKTVQNTEADEKQSNQSNNEGNKSISPIFKKDDLVLIHHQEVEKSQSPRKYFPGFHGPYVIKKVLEEKKYLITDTSVTQLTKKKIKIVCPEERIKRWITQEDLDEFEKLNK